MDRHRRTGSTGSGSTGSTGRSLDPKAQRDVDALLGISRREPRRDRPQDNSRNKPKDDQSRDHGRSLLPTSLFKRSTKKDKPRSQTDIQPAPRSHEPRHVHSPQYQYPPASFVTSPSTGTESSSASSLPPIPQPSPRPAQTFPPAHVPQTHRHRHEGNTSNPRLPDQPISDSSTSDLSGRRQLRLVNDTPAPVPPLPPEIVDQQRRHQHPQDLDLSPGTKDPVPRVHAIPPSQSPQGDMRVPWAATPEHGLERQHTQSSASMASIPRSPGFVPYHRGSAPEAVPPQPPLERSPPPSITTNDYAVSLSSRDYAQSTASYEPPPSTSSREQSRPQEFVEPESDEEENADFHLFAQATAGLGPDIGFNAPQPLAVSYPPREPRDQHHYPQPPQQITSPTVDSPTTTRALRQLAAQPSSHNVSPLQRPVSQISVVPDMWLSAPRPGGAPPAAAGPAPERQGSTRRLSFISVLEDDQQGPDDELPDYASSQAAAHAAGRAEASRRARELQRRWQQSGQNRGRGP